MSLITSISGIRGTLKGNPGKALTPYDIVKFAAAFGEWIRRKGGIKRVVVGRDARPSGLSISRLVGSTLQHMGIEVIDLGLAATPTVGMTTALEDTGGGIVITASHNPIEWNALKLLNHHGESLSKADGMEVLQLSRNQQFDFVSVGEFGQYIQQTGHAARHLDRVMQHPLVDIDAIQKAQFSVVVDAVNSVGGIVVPDLLYALGVKSVKKIHCRPDGLFPHDPEPLPEHLGVLRKTVGEGAYDLGIAVDPDVDRLALVQEDGVPFGEEYTLVAIADYVLGRKPGSVVSNLSSTRALQDVATGKGCNYYASAVGEVNVVGKMKSVEAVIGGEGNGGIIVPDLHYGRDALSGIALFLTHLARAGTKMSTLRKRYPAYHISKNKIELSHNTDIDRILAMVKLKYAREDIDITDGVKINFKQNKEWVHLRQSNTEPVIRIYAECTTKTGADNLSKQIAQDVHEYHTT